MKLSDAFSRLRFTLSKHHKPNEKDIEAFNKICEVFALSEKATIEDNQHFCKLYAWSLCNLIPHANDVDLANKKINSIIQEPIEMHINRLVMELKALELRKVFKDPFLNGKSPESNFETLANYPQFADLVKESWDTWDADTATANLNTNINLTLKCLNQLK
jgi:hypothetical protein